MGFIWTIIIGFLAGLIARWIHPGVSNEPSGFVVTTLLGVAGAFCRHLPGASDWLVSGWRRSRAHRSRSGSGHSSCYMGHVRKPYCTGVIRTVPGILTLRLSKAQPETHV
jgi:uncharacterized membrane protein YeaQ/YmgE (transglycosylase-associated protein family)